MNQPGLWDHFFALAVFVVYPLVAWRGFPRFVAKVRAYGTHARLAAYRQTILVWDAAAAVLLLMWGLAGRDIGELGIRASEPGRLAAGLALSAAMIGALFVQQRELATGHASRDKVVRYLGDLEAFMPRTAREQRWFRFVSLNAGVTEELIARGFLLWYLESLLGPAWGIAIAVLAFAFAHAYQGPRQMPALIVASAAFVALYLVSGSLLLPILVHAMVDLLQGHFIARALSTDR